MKGVRKRYTKEGSEVEAWKRGKENLEPGLAKLSMALKTDTPLQSFLNSEPSDPAQAPGWDSGAPPVAS